MTKHIIVVLLLTLATAYFSGITLSNEQVGNIFVVGILSLFAIFLLFKFGLHYKIQALNKYCLAFYYSVFEYKKKSQKSLRSISYANSVREQSEIAISANFDPNVATVALKVPISMYTKDSAYMPVLRARIQEAERLKMEAQSLQGQATKLMQETEEILVEKNLQKVPSNTSFWDSKFCIQEGIQNMVDLTAEEIKDQDYSVAPDYEIITQISLDNNPYFSTVLKYFNIQSVAAVISRASFMIILIGIIGTFAGFFLALSEGGDIKAGAAVAIISSLVGLPVALAMDYINTLYPDNERYHHALDRYKLSLEILFNHEKDRYPNRASRHDEDRKDFKNQFDDDDED